MNRITNNMMANTMLRNIGLNAERVNMYQGQAASTYRINRLSDDPLGMIVSLQSRARLYAMEQHNENLDQADSWLQMVETGLMEMNKIITTVYTDTIDAATDVKSSLERKAIAEKVREFRDQLLSTANSTITDKNLYGGYNATTRPFEVVDGVLYYNGYSMYSSEFTQLNPEQFVSDGLSALSTAIAAAAPATVNDARDTADAAGKAMETIVAAARSMYGNRTVEDKANPGTYITPTAQYILDAMQEAYTANSASWSQAEMDVAQSAITAATNAIQASLTDTGVALEPKALMDNLEAMAASMKTAVDDVKKAANRGEFATVQDALDYLAAKATDAQAAADKAVEATLDATTEKGIAYEGLKKYEIEVGYGQLMNITMNGVEIFGTGENDLYKIIDDLYKALTREFTDTNLGYDAYVYESTKFIDDLLTANPPVDLADAQATVGSISDAMIKVAQAGKNTNGSNMNVLLENMRAAVDTNWSDDQKAAAETLIAKATACVDAGMGRDDIINSLTAAEGAINKLNESVQALTDPPSTEADAVGLVSAATTKSYAALLSSTSGKKSGSLANDITPFISRLQNKQKDMMSILAIVGGRCNRVEIIRDRYSQDDLNYTSRISKIEDVDIAEALMHLKIAESVYNSALNAGARVIQPSLLDFLR